MTKLVFHINVHTLTYAVQNMCNIDEKNVCGLKYSGLKIGIAVNYFRDDGAFGVYDCQPSF